VYNLNYTPTALGVQSSREITSGGTGTKRKLIVTDVDFLPKACISEFFGLNFDRDIGYNDKGFPRFSSVHCVLPSRSYSYSYLLPMLNSPSDHSALTALQLVSTICGTAGSEIPLVVSVRRARTVGLIF
jgi:hypothetical protein